MGEKNVQSKIFVVEDRTLVQPFEEFQKEIDAICEKRMAYLDAWGSRGIITDPDRREIRALRIPEGKTLEDLKPLGWRKSSGPYVSASKKKNKEELAALAFHFPTEAFRPVLQLLNREGGAEKYLTNWLFFLDGEMYIGSAKYQFLGETLYLMFPPDPDVKGWAIPGCREIRPWEYQRDCEAFSKAENPQ